MKLETDKHNDACALATLKAGETLTEDKEAKALAFAKAKGRSHVEVYNADGFVKLLRVGASS